MIPPFEPESGYLPPGIHDATWPKILARFGFNEHRLLLLAGFKAAIDVLHQAGCSRVYLDGSFVTTKQIPNDFDACWEMAGVDFDVLEMLDPILLNWSQRRAAQKARFRGELFIAETAADMKGTPYVEFFQHNRTSGAQKGIVAINLGDLP